MTYNIELQKSGVPIYVQLKDQIKYGIATGIYPPGTQMPSVRQMAVDLRINPNTVSKAYAELEQEGYLRTRQGQGTFVSLNAGNMPDDLSRQQMEQLLVRLLTEAHQLGFTPGQVLQALAEKVTGLGGVE